MNQPKRNSIKNILQYAKTIYNNNSLKTGDSCPSDAKLLDYVYKDDVADDDSLTETVYKYITDHLQHCERCSVEQLKMDIERIKQELMLNTAFDSLPLEGSEQTEIQPLSKIKSYLNEKIPSLKAKLTKFGTEFITQLITPSFATATDVHIINNHIEYHDNYGTIEINCMQDDFADITLSWNIATLPPKSELWAQFVSPDNTKNILGEVVLGEDYYGELILTKDNLGFDPSTVLWALYILVRFPEE